MRANYHFFHRGGLVTDRGTCVTRGWMGGLHTEREEHRFEVKREGQEVEPFGGHWDGILFIFM